MPKRKSRAYYQYMLDVTDQKVGYYSSDDISLIAYDLLDEGDEQEALAACQKGLDQHPGDEFILIIKAKVLARMHRFDECERLLQGNPDEHSPFGISIRFALDIHRYGSHHALTLLLDDLDKQHLLPIEVIDIIDEYLEDIDNADVCLPLQQIAAKLHNPQSADDSQTSELLGRIGALLMDSSNHRQAIPVLERALDIDAYDIYSWQDLARCQLDLHLFDQCEQSCEMGLAIDPTNPLFNFALGFIQCEKQQYAEAIPHLELMRQYAEGNVRHENINLDKQESEQRRNLTYELLGNAYQAVGNLDKAIECYEVLIRCLPYFSEGHHRLALLLIERGDNQAALRHVTSAIEAEPDNSTYRALRATLHTELGDYDQALADLDRLIEHNPRSKTFLLAKAELSLSLKRFNEADMAYRSLLKLHPKDETSRSLLRAYFEAIGDDEALKKL